MFPRSRPSKMQALHRAKAQDLIAQLERQQQGQLQCLQELFGLASGDDAKKPDFIEEVEGECTHLASLPVMLHMPAFGGPSATSEDRMMNSMMQKPLLHRTSRKSSWPVYRLLKNHFTCLKNGPCLGVTISYVKGSKSARESQVAEVDWPVVNTMSLSASSELISHA